MLSSIKYRCTYLLLSNISWFWLFLTISCVTFCFLSNIMLSIMVITKSTQCCLFQLPFLAILTRFISSELSSCQIYATLSLGRLIDPTWHRSTSFSARVFINLTAIALLRSLENVTQKVTCSIHNVVLSSSYVHLCWLSSAYLSHSGGSFETLCLLKRHQGHYKRLVNFLFIWQLS